MLSAVGIPLLEGARTLLDEKEGSWEAQEVTSEVERPLHLLKFMETLNVSELPKDSCIREFLMNCILMNQYSHLFLMLWLITSDFTNDLS